MSFPVKVLWQHIAVGAARLLFPSITATRSKYSTPTTAAVHATSRSAPTSLVQTKHSHSTCPQKRNPAQPYSSGKFLLLLWYSHILASWLTHKTRTWVAVSGNRDEFYMNCAAVQITGAGTSTLEDYPNMYVGEMNIPGQISTGECRSTAGTAMLYPDPGPADRVTVSEVAGIPFKAPTKGNCFAPGGKAPVVGPPSSSSSSTSAVVVPSASSTYVAPVVSKPSTYVAPVMSTPSSYAVSVSPTTTITTRTTTTVLAYVPSPTAPAVDPNTSYSHHPHYRTSTTTTTCTDGDAAPTDTTETYDAPAGYHHGGWKKRRHRNF